MKIENYVYFIYIYMEIGLFKFKKKINLKLIIDYFFLRDKNFTFFFFLNLI
jgi:hypothetical protein